MNNIVSVDWLKQNMTKENLIILDGSLSKTAGGEKSKLEDSMIPGARYFDIKNDFCDLKSEYPNTFPSEQQFELGAKKIGINKDSQIVVYDNMGIYSSPRVWFLFKAMGHKNIAVLNGGLPAWLENKNEIINKQVDSFDEGDFKANFNKNWIKTYEEVLLNSQENTFQLIDARSKGRFDGNENEPRKHLQSGHIKNSINIPYQKVLIQGKMKSIDQLKTIFEELHTNSKESVFSCGSGLTACILVLAYHYCYKKISAIYDGSWSEWADKQGLLKTKT